MGCNLFDLTLSELNFKLKKKSLSYGFPAWVKIQALPGKKRFKPIVCWNPISNCRMSFTYISCWDFLDVNQMHAWKRLGSFFIQISAGNCNQTFDKQWVINISHLVCGIQLDCLLWNRMWHTKKRTFAYNNVARKSLNSGKLGWNSSHFNANLNKKKTIFFHEIMKHFVQEVPNLQARES